MDDLTTKSLFRQINNVKTEVSGIKEFVMGGFYSVEEFAEKTGLDVRTINNYCRQGLLQATQMHKNCSWMIDKSEYTRLKEWAKENKRKEFTRDPLK